MKALSVHPYYATMIAAGEKKVEYRSWKTDYRGLLLICASQFNDGPQFPRGYALCIANLSEITGSPGKYEWHFDGVVQVYPFKVKGKLHLFDVPDEKITVLYEAGKKDVFLDFDTAYDMWCESGICSDVGA